jgi:hypothetical protein
MTKMVEKTIRFDPDLAAFLSHTSQALGTTEDEIVRIAVRRLKDETGGAASRRAAWAQFRRFVDECMQQPIERQQRTWARDDLYDDPHRH